MAALQCYRSPVSYLKSSTPLFRSLAGWRSPHRTLQVCQARAIRTFLNCTPSQHQTVLHHLHRTPNQTLTRLSVRHFSQSNHGGRGGQGGGGASGRGAEGKSTSSGGGGGFFQNFVDNLRKAIKGSEVQDSLKGFNEEREKMQQSYVIQQTKLKWKVLSEKLGHIGSKGSEKTHKGWSAVKKTSSKVYKDASETELAKKGQVLGAQLAKDVQKTAGDLAKTDVGLAVKKGVEVVKEDLIDDIVKESNPYKPPEKLMRRSDMASKQQSQTYQPNEKVKDVVTTKESKWKNQLKELRENNPISNTFYNLKTKYDESDNIFIRASRVVTDRVEDALSGAMTQSDMAETLAEIHKIDPSFNKEDFSQKQCKYEIIPTILEAYMQGNEHILKDWCHEPAFNVLSAMMKQKVEPGVKQECKVLEVRDIDIVMAKLIESGPVLVLMFNAQQLTRKRGAEGAIENEILEYVSYVWALCRDQTIYDPRTAWRLLEFGIQSSGKMLI